MPKPQTKEKTFTIRNIPVATHTDTTRNMSQITTTPPKTQGPMGVSEWERVGKLYGYWHFFVRKWVDLVMDASYERMSGPDWKAEQHGVVCELLTNARKEMGKNEQKQNFMEK